MVAHEQDELVTKTSVILSKPNDWETWLFVRKDTADRDGLWPYVDPGLSADKLKKLQDKKPQEIPLWKFKKTQVPEEEREDIDILDLSAEEISVYNAWARKYEQDESEWRQKDKALRSFNSEIARTINVKHLGLIVDCSDPYSRLTTLKKHLCLSVGEQNHQLRSRYKAVCTRPQKADLDDWLDEWVTITRLLREAKMSEVDGNRSQEDFILSIRGLDDNWASTQLQELVRKEQQGEQYTSTADLVAEFRSYYRRIRTKLRHVDTHQMWLRQEVQQQRMQVVWCPTADMPADGLTKALVRQKHNRFVEQLGLESVERYIVERSQGTDTPDIAGLTGWY